MITHMQGKGMNGKAQSAAGPLFVLAGALCFSTTGFTQALIAPSGATPMGIGGMRIIVGGLALLLYCAVRGSLPSFRGWPLKEFLGSVAGILCFQVFFFCGTLRAGVAAGTLAALGFSPVAAAVFSLLFFREKPPAAWYPSTILAIAGILLMGRGSGCGPEALFFPLAAGTAYGLNLACCRRLVAGKAPETVMSAIFAVCAVCFIPLLVASPPTWVLTPEGLLAAAHLGVVATAGAYLFMLCGLRRTSAPVAATLGLAEPVCAALLAFFFLGEALPPLSLLGICMILSSALVIIVFPEKRPVTSFKNGRRPPNDI